MKNVIHKALEERTFFTGKEILLASNQIQKKNLQNLKMLFRSIGHKLTPTHYILKKN